MDERLFKTKINKRHKLYSDYVVGRISGMQFMACESSADRRFAVKDMSDCKIMATECAEAQYLYFASIVEDHYPGLCEFDYKG